jgi:hypothetical protein
LEAFEETRDRQGAFPRLGDDALATLEERGERRTVDEGELNLRLHAGDLRHTESGGTTSGVTEEGRPSDARLAPHDEHGGLTLARVC